MAGEVVEIGSGGARARVALRGAELTAWEAGGVSWIWPGDAVFWDESAPVLFPVVGWTRNGEVRVGGRTYPLGLHGFARFQPFAVETVEADRVVMRLVSSPQTLAVYPFAFSLAVTYTVTPDAFAWSAEVANTGEGPMPYAVGFHPGFNLPLAGTQAPLAVVFDAQEEAEVPVVAPGGLLSPRRMAIPLHGRRLPIEDRTFASQSLCFVEARSRGLVLGPERGRALRFDFSDLPTIVLWSRPGAPFVCVEGWAGSGDPVDFAGDLFEKPGMRTLAPGETAVHHMAVRIVEAQGGEPLDPTPSHREHAPRDDNGG